MNKFYLTSILCLFVFFLRSGIQIYAQQPDLSVESIMRDPMWMGTFPSQIHWGEHNEYIYFHYNRDQDPEDSLYRIGVKSRQLEKVSWVQERKLVPSHGVYNADRTKKAFSEGNSLKIYDVNERKLKTLLEMDGPISNLDFPGREDVLAFRYGNDAYVLDMTNNSLRRVTNIKSGEEPTEKKASTQDAWLRQENLYLLGVVKEREDRRDSSISINKLKKGKEEFSFSLDKRQLSSIKLSPGESYAALLLHTPVEPKATNVPDFIATDGYTASLSTRSKVGMEPWKSELAIYNLEKDTIYFVSAEDLPGIKDLPDYVKDYPDKD